MISLSNISCRNIPFSTLPNLLYRILSQLSHCDFPFGRMALFLSWHHFPSADMAFMQPLRSEVGGDLGVGQPIVGYWLRSSSMGEITPIRPF